MSPHKLISLTTLTLLASACAGADPTLTATSQPVVESVKQVSAALYESDDSNCGAEGYECLNGRTCENSRCLPAWQPLSTVDAPAPRFGAAATRLPITGYLDNQYIVTGGCTSYSAETPASKTAAAYDPVTDTWSALEDMNEGRSQHGAITMFGTPTPVVFGGVDTCDDLDTVVDSFETFESDDWTSLPMGEDGPTARYNMALVNSDWNMISVFGGGTSSTTTATTGFFRGNPHTTDAWTSLTCTLENCERDGVAGFYDDGTVRFLSDPPWLSYSITEESWANWDEPYDQNNSGDTSPQFGEYFTDRGQLRLADDSNRVYIIDHEGHVAIYSRDSGTWERDTEDAPSGFCNDAPPVYVRYDGHSQGEVIAFSGGCDSILSSVGGRYQPPAPGLDLDPPAEPVLHGPTLISVPAGTFNVGESSGVRTITYANGFGIDETEVTTDQYKECVDAEVCSTPGTDTACNWDVSGHGDHPINCVTYAQAEDYCEWAGKRLPTQQEWEYAARYADPTTHKYPWGNSSTDYYSKLNMVGTGDGYEFTAPVGHFSPGIGALGVKDMAGNVWEWTQSDACFNETGACDSCPAGETCSTPCDVCSTTDKVIKGGGYGHALSYARGAMRYPADPVSSVPTFGFRCAKTEVSE